VGVWLSGGVSFSREPSCFADDLVDPEGHSAQEYECEYHGCDPEPLTVNDYPGSAVVGGEEFGGYEENDYDYCRPKAEVPETQWELHCV
jgi:hypothetical protein